MKRIEVDVLIIGGGIAGLWLQRRLEQRGYQTLLLEAANLGGKQSVCSQGIIHGGTKYALNGMLTPAANAIGEMPARWQAALAGEDEIDLRQARLLSDAHYLWSTASLSSKLTSFFASKALRGRVNNDAPLPPLFQHPQFKGNCYRLNELVLDVPSVLACLQVAGKQLQGCAGETLRWQGDHWYWPEYSLQIRARRQVLCAGEGSEALQQHLGLKTPMQRRPLHMVMVKHRYPDSLFAHCIGASSKPLATITSHPHSDGSQVWYIGGEVAESGVERSEAEQIAHAKHSLQQLLPWVDLGQADWATLRINRAEPKQSSLSRPDSAYAEDLGDFILCWPTKLALAPNLSDQVLPMLAPPAGLESYELPSELPQPAISQPIWEQLL